MSGYTKHLCENEIIDVKKELNKYLTSIESILPFEYGYKEIEYLLCKYYPHEMFLISEKHTYYFYKERSLISKGKNSRYTYREFRYYIEKSPEYLKMMSDDYKAKHKENFDGIQYAEKVKAFSAIRNPKIERITAKIEKAKAKTQKMEPEFLDALMGLYDRKDTTQKDKVYIMKELEKYYCPKVIRFFSKKVDTEYNRQLREMAFYHLQSLGFRPLLRKQKYMIIPSKNKKRRAFLKNIYAYEKFNLEEIPEELEYRIENSKEQKIKTFDYFISHSSKDHDEIQALIHHLNSKNKNIYCDWINDNDYLKRHLVGEATLNVILKRLQQSEALIFVISDNSTESIWCKYELNDFYQQHKPIYFINIEDIQGKIIILKKYDSMWYVDPNYKETQLF